MNSKLFYASLLFIFISSCRDLKRNDSLCNKQHSKDNSPEINCTCFDGIGSIKGNKPILNFTFENGKTISFCGFYDKEMTGNGSNGCIMSEFNVFDCQTSESLAEFDAVQICRIIEKQNAVTIQELKYLPVGKNWEWELIQIGEQTFSQNKNKIAVSGLIPKLENFIIDKKTQQEFLTAIKPKIDENWELEIGKLEALSLLGNVKAWEILKNYEKYKGEKTDGALAETWKASIVNVKWIKSY